jgi:hypothetical protein
MLGSATSNLYMFALFSLRSSRPRGQAGGGVSVGSREADAVW